MMQAAKKITDSTSWKQEIIYLGDHALSQNRIPQAIAYYRMNEFFDGNPGNKEYYIKTTELFYGYYHSYFDERRVQKIQVSHEDAMLPIMVAKAQKQYKGNVLRVQVKHFTYAFYRVLLSNSQQTLYHFL